MIVFEVIYGKRRGLIEESPMLRISDLIGEKKHFLGLLDRKTLDVICVAAVSESQKADIAATISDEFERPMGTLLEASKIEEGE